MDAVLAPLAIVDISFLEEIVRENKEILSKGHRMISQYREEQSINNDYRGRQLLELIQNADDAGSSYVSICLDTQSHILKIENEGEPFSTEGFRSLMIANLSSKRKKKYIGNKGLGVRSILNWSSQVTISSGGVIVTFSKQLAEDWFQELFPSELDRQEILKEFQYSEGAIPFPVFSIPDIKPAYQIQKITTIEIDYFDDDEIIKDIQEQLVSLQKEVLLFLNNIDTIRLSINGEITEFTRVRVGKKTTIGNQTWHIYDNKVNGEDPLLPSQYHNREVLETESYCLKIAVQEGLKDKGNNLFCYFPTKINMNLPMVIHGTFELDSSRNRIIETQKNKFLISELIDLIFKVSDDFFPGTASWDKLRLFNYGDNKNAVLEKDFGFYKLIEDRIKTLPVFPTLDGKYKPYQNIKYHYNEFPELIKVLQQESYFPDLILQIPLDLINYLSVRFADYTYSKRYTDTVLRSKIEAVSKDLVSTKIDVGVYARWIASMNNHFTYKGTAISVVFNDDNEIIDKTKTIFTPATHNAQIDIPKHVRIEYLNENLANRLYSLYNFGKDDRSRKLKDKLDNFVNIQSFEPAPVLTRIVTSTNELLKDRLPLEKKQEVVKATLLSLYNYYKNSQRAKETQIRSENIPVINALGDIVLARDTFLSSSYNIGKLRTEILGEIYDQKSLIADPEELGIENSDVAEDFLINFLGVNKFLRLESWRAITDSSYDNFVFNIKGRITYRSLSIYGSKITNLGILQKRVKDGLLSRENFVAWICVDDEVRTVLQSTSDTKFRYSLSNELKDTYNHAISDVPSYVKFQLKALSIFENYLLNDLDVPFTNEFKFDFNAACFTSRAINESAIKTAMLNLGAKSEFKELSIKRVEEILRSLKSRDPLGRHARKIYQAAIEKYNKDGQTLSNYSGLELHAIKNNVKQYLPHQNVFYSNKIGLPRKVLSDNGILNYPRRAGEQSIYKFLKVGNFDSINYSVGSYEVNQTATSILHSYLKTIKPFILTARLQRVASDIRGAINAVKSIQIKLCSNFSYENESQLKAEQYDFVRESAEANTFLILSPEYQSKDELVTDSDLSDVISEIFTIVFDVVNLEDDIRLIFRNNLKDTEHQIIKKYGEEALINARAKLEITDGEEHFWKCIYHFKSISDKFPEIDDEADFREQISSELNIDPAVISRIDYDPIESENNIKYLVDLFTRLNISLEEFNEMSGSKIYLLNYHYQKIRAIIELKSEDFKTNLWHKYTTENTEIQRRFIADIRLFCPAMFSDVAENNKLTIVDDYDAKMAAILMAKCGIEIKPFTCGPISYKDVFDKNRKLIGLTDEQIKQLSEEEKSLLYFQVDQNELNKIKYKFKAPVTPPPAPPPSGQPAGASSQPAKPKNIVPLPPSNKGKKHSGGGGGGGGYGGGGNYGGSGHSPEDEEARRELGRKSELEVINSLKEKYPNGTVEWVSEYSDYYTDKGDKWGYDIKYRENVGEEWRYVEVKSFYKGYFFFTARELQAAIDNPGKYYIFLVEETRIWEKLFSEFLDEDDELLQDNAYFTIKVNDYKFIKL